MKNLHKERKHLRNEYSQAASRYNGLISELFDKNDFQKHLESRPDYNSLTVNQVEGIARSYFEDNLNNRLKLNKTASLKSTAIGAAVTGIPTAIATGNLSFKETKKDRKDKNGVRNQINNYKKVSEI